MTGTNDDSKISTDEQNDELRKKVEEAQQKAEEKEKSSGERVKQAENEDSEVEGLKEALARAMADLQNYKRRSEEEKASFVKYANAELLKSLLPIFDNLNRSAAHLPDDLKENEWAKGIMHIHTDLLKTLAALGIEKMQTVGEKLDPNKHEGLMSGPGEKDVIVEEFEPGYLMNGEVLKAAKVKVGDGSK